MKSDSTAEVPRQVTRTLSGSVADITGGPILGASVTSRNNESGESFQTESDGQGQFQLPNLPIGQYEVSTASAGFRICKKTLELTASKPAYLNFALQFGAVTMGEVIESQPRRKWNPFTKLER